MKVYIITLSNPEKTIVYVVGAKDRERALNLIGENEKIVDSAYDSLEGVEVDSILELSAIANEEFCIMTFDNSNF